MPVAIKRWFNPQLQEDVQEEFRCESGVNMCAAAAVGPDGSNLDLECAGGVQVRLCGGSSKHARDSIAGAACVCCSGSGSRMATAWNQQVQKLPVSLGMAEFLNKALATTQSSSNDLLSLHLRLQESPWCTPR
jgi:hypothetical protein